MVASVKEFIKIFKWAVFKFYKITRYMRSQEDTLDQVVTESILTQQVSSVLISAAEKQLGPDLSNFKQALESLEGNNVSFWLSGKGDVQFWLDRERFKKVK